MYIGTNVSLPGFSSFFPVLASPSGMSWREQSLPSQASRPAGTEGCLRALWDCPSRKFSLHTHFLTFLKKLLFFVFFHYHLTSLYLFPSPSISSLHRHFHIEMFSWWGPLLSLPNLCSFSQAIHAIFTFLCGNVFFSEKGKFVKTGRKMKRYDFSVLKHDGHIL